MCMKPMRIKSVSPCGQKFAFIPCGKCAECRKSYRSQWFFRLAVEMQKAQERNWHIGFFTLTYNDEHLPHVCGVPCFARSDVRRLILRLRKKYHKEEGTTGLRYLIASEFGENTHRPHYHGVIAFPPSIDPKDMLESIEYFWSEEDLSKNHCVPLGFVFPSEKVYASEKFVCKSAYASAMYASKYCCKDVAHEELIAPLGLSNDQKRECCSFHIQSRSLGLELLKNATDEQKYDLIVHGLQLVGHDKCLKIPLYIRNKIFFDIDYQYDDHGNRLVRRLRSPFMKKYAKEIFDNKCKFYQGLFRKMLDNSFWSSYGKSDVDARKCADYALGVSIYFEGVKNMAEYFVAYYGVDPSARFDCSVDSWLYRYESCFFEDKSAYDMRNVPQDCALSCLFSLLDPDTHPDVSDKRSNSYVDMRELDRISDFHTNLQFQQVG